MMKSWSNIVLILSVCAVVSPTPVPQYGFENILNPPGIFSAGQNFMNPLWNLPGSLLFRRQPINLQNPDNRPSSGLPGASNILAEGLRDTGAGIGNAISIAISTIANTLGTFLSGILGNGMVNDAKYETFYSHRVWVVFSKLSKYSRLSAYILFFIHFSEINK